MSRFYPNRLVASLVITALSVTAGLTPVVAIANEAQVKSTYNVQSTQSLINTLTRLGGYDRYGTAVQIADHGWQSASTAVLAPSGDLNMVDALASSSLAKAVDGPILLVDKDSVPSSTMTELKKLGVTKVYMVSGTAVISAKVESDLSAVGIQAVRIGGYDRYETAVNIAKEIQTIKPFQEVVVTNAFANVDAISIAPIAAAKGIPVLLVNKDSVPSVVSDFINSSGINKTYVIGGTAVVSDSVKDALPNSMRLGGYDRFDTNTEVLKKFENLIIGGTMFFANGSDSSLIDSLTGAPMAAKFGGAIVLSNKDAVPDGTKGFIKTNIALKNPGILGGTAVMSDSAIQSLGYAQPDQSAILNGAVELNTPNATFKDKTINGNILINADSETLQNVIVNGTVFVDPGNEGSATLDGVQANRIVVLSGADRSIYLKKTKSDSLVVSSFSDVHVVAETGTTIGSTLVKSDAIVESQSGANVGPLIVQSQRGIQINVQLQGTYSNDVTLSGSVKLTAADGAVVPLVNVTGATTPIQLAGYFSSVSISDNSSITLLFGKIDKLETKGTSEIVVKSGAEITTLNSVTGNVKVSGGGTVNGTATTDTPTELGSIPSTPVVTPVGSGTSGGRDRSDNTTVADNAAIAAARTALETVVTLNPVEGTDTNVVDIAQALVNTTPAAVGVTVTVSDASGNSSIAADGAITYTAKTGDVVFALNKGRGTQATATLSVVVPHSKAECDAAIAAAKTALKAAATLNPVEGIDTNVIVMAQALVNTTPAALGVTVSLKSSANSNITTNGAITYQGETGDVEFALNMGTGTEDTVTMSVVVPHSKAECDAAIAAAKTALEAVTLNPINGIDTNVATMAQDLLKAIPAAEGVTVTVKNASGNTSIAPDGEITYTANTGNVVFALNMGTGTEATATMSVVVP